MILLPRAEWTPAVMDTAAHLITDPVYNGTGKPMTPEECAAIRSALPTVIPEESPALAVMDGERAVLVFGFWPFDPQIGGGIFHIAGTGEVREAWNLVAQWLDALPVQVRTFTDKPALARLAVRAGFRVIGQQDGFTLLAR